MSTDYNYDEQGQFFPFFILTLTGLVTLPLTYNLLKPSKELENTAPRIKSDFKPQHGDIIDAQKRKRLRKQRRIKRIVTVVAGYAIMAWMVYLIAVTARSVPKIWDPYEILGISRSADEKAISRHYKRLSLIYHPDKIRPDPSKNETIETLNDRFVELTKAYKALTDEEVRNNYVQYGHPDGKQSFSIGIALPKLIVTEGNGKYVLLVYGGMLGVLLPYIVGKWWYGSQRYTKEKVLVASAGNIFREYKDDISDAGIIDALSSGIEFKDMLKGSQAEAGLAKLEKRVLAEDSILSPEQRKTLAQMDDSTRRKALALLWAYLDRIDLEDATLNGEKYEAAPIALSLNEAFTAISLAFGNLRPILGSFRTSQHLIQAVAPGSSPLLQLPHFNNEVVKAIEGADSKDHYSVQKFMGLPEDKRRSLTVGPGLLSEQQYSSAVAVAKQLPALEVSKAFFKVMGEKVVTPSSLVQFVVKARLIPPGFSNVPPVSPEDLEDADPDEDDLDALMGRKPPKNRPTKLVNGKRVENTFETIQPPLAHAPYLARDHSPRWHIFLADSKQGKMAVPPFTFTTFDKPLFDEAGKPTFNVQTLKMQFQAPPQVGDFTFIMHMLCDSYLGLDTKMEITLHVDDPAKAAALDVDDDISEPDEDSLAGQMHALKTGQPPKKRAKKASDESSEEESDTDGDAGDTSDTNTETDVDD
ncbi:J domain-containing protein [Aspergillus clavatus NRRL 1]|uniref:Protein translocation complex componenet (Npl1), putative n=1 Tax=Aspergillus clavatus (strain ATCC 1007 / CBS 513.65 / DSM 816 / NCTC 3887 / NRRL 1 / QM 1276 / 107) TaxID=344612 RepID=A1CNW4_ASPCL|nr:protein translocation complex component (Npl1), putative [Aspergillus clavatus NRRL 1]EAW07335.1 protein translocation complex componenet (Npl1), putative [Aspergillus clavatus NRRL 1]